MACAQSHSFLVDPIKSTLSVYGASATFTNCSSALHDQLHLFLKPFFLNRVHPCQIQGEIRPFDLGEVTHSLSSASTSRRHGDGLTCIYSHGERHWVVDDRWGVCEIDLLKHRWRSWLIPRPSLDPVHLAEAVAVWPLAQLLRAGGIQLVPAVAIERSGWGALIIAPYPITAEISRVMRAGYRVIAQRWTALVPRNGRFVLQHVPGVVESPAERGRSIGRNIVWTDLLADNPWASADLAWCDAVLAIAPGRRLKSRGQVIPAVDAHAWLRRVWPINDLPADGARFGHPAAALADQSLCLNIELSRNPDEFLQLVEYARLRNQTKPQVSINRVLRRVFTPPARIAS
jgi:hypothetical protein